MQSVAYSPQVSTQREDSFDKNLRSNQKTNMQTNTRHKTSPKQKLQIPQKYTKLHKSNQNSLKSNEMFTFHKSSQQNKNILIQTQFKKKLNFGQQKKRFRSSADIKKALTKNYKNETPMKRFPIKNHESQKKQIEFDFGHLDRPKSIQKLHHQSVFPLKKNQLVIPNSSTKQPESNKKLNDIIYSKALNFQSNEKQLRSSRKKRLMEQKINNQLMKSNKKRGNSQCSDQRQNRNPNILSINDYNLKIDKTIDPNQKKKITSRIVTMFSNGKVQTKIINYPDVSQYLRLCGIRS